MFTYVLLCSRFPCIHVFIVLWWNYHLIYQVITLHSCHHVNVFVVAYTYASDGVPLKLNTSNVHEFGVVFVTVHSVFIILFCQIHESCTGVM